ncbi:MAG TPA: hypothetical protein VHQ97_09705, partial [Solirubrobacterales bacterium]|nr:hypothetical protein [Solirubrobacterales bacterium]
VNEHRSFLSELRGHYAHVEERALGRIHGVRTWRAEAAYEVGKVLSDRVLTDGTNSITIDADITRLCIETRDFLIAACAAVAARTEKTGTSDSPA